MCSFGAPQIPTQLTTPACVCKLLSNAPCLCNLPFMERRVGGFHRLFTMSSMMNYVQEYLLQTDLSPSPSNAGGIDVLSIGLVPCTCVSSPVFLLVFLQVLTSYATAWVTVTFPCLESSARILRQQSLPPSRPWQLLAGWVSLACLLCSNNALEGCVSNSSPTQVMAG